MRRQKREVNLEAMVEEGESSAYEALQLYKSRCNRMKGKGEFLEAINVAAKGAKAQLVHGYESSGVELCNILVDLLTAGEFDINPDLRNLLNEIDSAFASMPKNEKGASDKLITVTAKDGSKQPAVPKSSRIDFLKSLVTWSMKCGQRDYGDPMLHLQLANTLWDHSRGFHRKSIYHFAVGEAPTALWAKIQEEYVDTNAPEGVSSADVAREKERLVVLGVLHFIAVENLRDANTLYRAFNQAKSKNGKKSKKTDEERSESIIFCDYLLQTCLRDAAPLFKQLCNTYISHLNWDPIVPALLMGPIASRIFNIPPNSASLGPSPGGMGGMPGMNPQMMAMMQNMMRGSM